MNNEQLKKCVKNLSKDLELSRFDLDKQMCRQAGLYIYYAMAFSGAVRDEKRTELKLEMRETKIYRQLGDHHSRVTEKMMVAECHIDKTWIRLKQTADQAAFSADVLKGACQALIHKRDMLVNLGATVRTEMAGEISTSKP